MMLLWSSSPQEGPMLDAVNNGRDNDTWSYCVSNREFCGFFGLVPYSKGILVASWRGRR
jgi:hypothetical protein